MARKIGSRTRGEGQLGLIVGIVFFGCVAFALFKIVPLHIHGSEVLDAMNEQANFGSYKANDKIAWEVFQKGQQVGVDLPLNEVKVTRRGSSIVIACKYTEAVEVFGYKYVYNFDHTVEKPTF